MAIYRPTGTTGATAATDAHAVAEIWNPSGTKRIRVIEFSIVAAAAPGAGSGILFRRTSARGTAGSTVTPTAEHSDERDAAPDSGFLLDLATFSAQPTLIAGDLHPAWVLAAVAASGIVYSFANAISRGIVVPPGTGLAVVNRAAIVVPASEVGFVVED